MKKLVLSSLLLFHISISFGQSNEFSIQVNSGLFSYGGKSAAESSFVISNGVESFYWPNNSFGNKSGVSYGLTMQYQRITSNRFIWGLAAGFDQLTSKIKIDQVLGQNGVMRDITGKILLVNNVPKINPHFGYRFRASKIDLDLTGGLNLGYINKSKEHGKITDGSYKYDFKSDFTRINTKFDFGPKIGLAAYYKNAGLIAAYTYGLINYRRNLDGANEDVYSRYLSLGISYRFR